VLAYLILMTFPVAMAFAAANDLFTMKIPNRISLALIGAAPSQARWDQQTVDVGGLPGQKAAISPATSRAYIPLLQQRALSVFDGVNASRLELDIKPTAVASGTSSAVRARTIASERTRASVK